MAGPIRLRARRATYAKRRGVKRRLLGVGGVLAVLVGAACWAPLASTALAPTHSAVDSPAQVLAVVPVPATAAPIATRSVPAIAPLPTPTVVPTPVVPTITATGLNALASIRADRTAQWVKNHTETPLRSGPTGDSTVFTQMPQWSLLKQIDSRPDWLEVQYSGDGDTRQPGPGCPVAS